jgi:hypothetical protein
MSERITHCYRCRAETVIDTDGRGNLTERTTACVCPPSPQKRAKVRRGPKPTKPPPAYCADCGVALKNVRAKRCGPCGRENKRKITNAWHKANPERMREAQKRRRTARKAENRPSGWERQRERKAREG